MMPNSHSGLVGTGVALDGGVSEDGVKVLIASPLPDSIESMVGASGSEQPIGVDVIQVEP